MLNVFYGIMNRGYRWAFGSRYMLHAPLFLHDDDTLYDAQRQFTDHCLTYLPPLAGKRVLDIGCGNGMPAVHLLNSRHPAFVQGIDPVASAIRIAQRNAGNDARLLFTVDDAQRMDTVGDHSIDVAVCIESALHYRDKDGFLRQASRVIAPGGTFLVADLLQRRSTAIGLPAKIFLLFNWSAGQYREAFARHGFRIERDESLNGLLLPQFEGMFRRIKKETLARNKWTGRAILPVIKAATALYTYQLKHRFEYRLFVLGKEADALPGDGM